MGLHYKSKLSRFACYSFRYAHYIPYFSGFALWIFAYIKGIPLSLFLSQFKLVLCNSSNIKQLLSSTFLRQSTKTVPFFYFNMGNSASHMNHIDEINNALSLCEERKQCLKLALKRRTKLADAQLNYNLCHQDVADTIKWFVQEQRETRQDYRVDQAEDSDEDREASMPSPTFDINIENLDQGDGQTIRVSEFFKALEDVEKQFRNAYESGKAVSTKLEKNSVENKFASQPLKLIRSLTRSRSRVGCSTFDESETMGSTVAELSRWEHKLYEELKTKKAETRRLPHEDSESKNQYSQGSEKLLNVDFIVAEKGADNSSKEITKLRDQHLLPKLAEQLHGLMGNWKEMSEFHETQKKIMSQVKESPNCPLLCDQVHQKATETLKAQLHNWCVCFASYISLQTAYIKHLYCWLSKNNPPKLLGDNNGDWLACLKNLKTMTKVVTSEMKKFRKHVVALLAQQRREHDQKMKVNKLENRVKHREQMISQNESSEAGMTCHDESESPRIQNWKVEIEELEERIEKNKEKLQTRMQETQQMVNQFQAGFSNVFQTWAEFSSNATEIYTELIKYLPKIPLDTQR